jgi:glutamine amidotransferase
MCRLLAVTSARPVDVSRHLDAFTRVCRDSREYQGHGWGCGVWRGGGWEMYRTTRPIWEDGFRPAGEVRTFVAHARSAFREEEIALESNMPFVRGDRAFIFNGELRGVRLAMEGRTGAEKLFRYIDRRGPGTLSGSVERAMSVVRKRTARIRACNFILAEPGRFHLHSLFEGESDYFTLWLRRSEHDLVIGSQPYPEESGWEAIPNDCRRSYPWSS